MVKIIQEEDFNHGAASLPSGYMVFQVVELTEPKYGGKLDPEEAAERLDVEIDQIETALEYYEENPDEIEEILEEERETNEEYRPEYLE